MTSLLPPPPPKLQSQVQAAMSRLRAPMAWCKKLLRRQLARALSAPYLLPDGNSWNRSCPGWDHVCNDPPGSGDKPLSEYLLQGRQLAPIHSPSIADDDTIQTSLLVLGGAAIPDWKREAQHTFYDGPVELYLDLTPWAKLLQLPEEVHSLLRLLQDGVGVCVPAQRRGDDYSENWSCRRFLLANH